MPGPALGHVDRNIPRPKIMLAHDDRHGAWQPLPVQLAINGLVHAQVEKPFGELEADKIVGKGGALVPVAMLVGSDGPIELGQSMELKALSNLNETTLPRSAIILALGENLGPACR